VTDIYSRNLVGDLVDNICNFVLRFYDVSFLVSNFLSLQNCHLGYQELTLYQNGNILNSVRNNGQSLCTYWCSCMQKI
jgi:hypothetical protein